MVHAAAADFFATPPPPNKKDGVIRRELNFLKTLLGQKISRF